MMSMNGYESTNRLGKNGEELVYDKSLDIYVPKEKLSIHHYKINPKEKFKIVNIENDNPDRLAEGYLIKENEEETLAKYIYSTASKCNLCEQSLLKWALWLNRSVFKHPLGNFEVRELVDRACRKFPPGDQIWVKWCHHYSLLKQSTGVATDVLRDGLNQYGIDVRYNTRSDVVEIYKNDEYGQLHPNDIKQLLSFANSSIITGLNIKFKKEHGHTYWGLNDPKSLKWNETELKTILAKMYRFKEVDPFQVDYLDELPDWDGIPRVDFLLENCFDIQNEDIDIARFASRSIMMGMVGRTIEPGRKHDECVILIGNEGIGKSTFCNKLVPDDNYFADGLNFYDDSKSIIEKSLGQVVVEISEMQGLNKATEEKAKQILTSRKPRIRLSYRPDPMFYPMTAIFIGTANKSFRLPYNNLGGNRRYIPIWCGAGKDYPSVYVEENRDQLWSEAIQRFHDGEKYYITDEYKDMLSKNAYAYCRAPGPKDIVTAFLEKNRGEELTCEEIWEACNMDFPTDKYGITQMRRDVQNSGLVEERKRMNSGYRYSIST